MVAAPKAGLSFAMPRTSIALGELPFGLFDPKNAFRDFSISLAGTAGLTIGWATIWAGKNDVVDRLTAGANAILGGSLAYTGYVLVFNLPPEATADMTDFGKLRTKILGGLFGLAGAALSIGSVIAVVRGLPAYQRPL